MSEPDLLESVTQLGAVQHHREVNLVRLVTQLEARGVSSPGGLSRVDWLRAVDPTLTAAAAKAITTCAAGFNQPRWAQLRDAVTGTTEAGEGGRVTVGKAAQVIDFYTRLKPVADPDDLDQAIAHLTGQAAGLRGEQLAKLARELSDQVRPPKDADEHDRRHRDGRGLWFTAPNAAGMIGMSGTVDPEGAATIEAAIDPLSPPCPLTDSDGVKIVVTIDLEPLRDQMRNGRPPTWATTTSNRGGKNGGGKHGSGSCRSGDVLTAATVRRMACDAAIIPVVLGADSQPLDVGRGERLVTRAVRTALWLRDGGCSFPGCSTPAQWTDAHHGQHWLHGGKTSLSNLALCAAAIVYVHEKNLTATITATAVTWHTWQHGRASVKARC